ncbi:MAG TPA: glycosyltransferase family 4 protein, partial [Gemmatimonadales bacterium]|nr:glycosyltransferase family 4 protein [Gemmatimonadales bacterium]
SERLFWLPFERDRNRVADLLAAVDLYVAPCSLETFGLSALEALASGTPLLTADRGGVAETATRSGAGALFQSGNGGALTDAACRLFAGDLKRLGALGRSHTEAYHAWDAVFDHLFGIYQRILSQ